MTEEQRKNLENLLKENEVIVNLKAEQIEPDFRGFPQFKYTYENPPKNYKLVSIIAGFNIAILENLDYEPAISSN